MFKNKIKTTFSGLSYSSFLLLVILALGILSCAQDARMNQAFEADKIAFGRINQINIICDQTLWDGAIGDSLRYYYSSAYPILPQPEPIFDLRHMTMEDLRKDPLRKELRTFIVVGNLADDRSEAAALIRQDVGSEKITTSLADDGYGNSVVKNKWAKGQMIIYLFGQNEKKLAENIINSYTAVAKRINQADEEMIEATAFFSGENVSLAEEIRAMMDLKIRIPEEFSPAIKENNMVWLRRETSDASSNIMIKKIPYVDQSQLSREGLKKIRNEIGKEYVSSSLPNTYMRINDIDLPLFVETTRLNGDYALEARGIWDIVNDFMGGSFISYLVYDPGKTELLYIDAFVHAPGKDKRDLMQQLEYILHTAKY